MLIARLKRVVALVTVAGLALAGLLPLLAQAAVAPYQPLPATAVTADRLPTVQIDGVVWSQATVGNTVYAGGSFHNARPAGAAPGANQTTRNNLLAYDITTGNLVTSFTPDLNGQVLSVTASPDGSRIYVVGDFTVANGQARRRVAAYSTATGRLITSFNPVGVNSQARAVIATNSTVHVGGGFLGAGGTLRNNLAAFRASDGALLPWNPNADATVWALAISADGSSVFAGGQFQNVGGRPAYGLAKIAASSGALDTSWQATNTVRVAGKDAGVASLRVQNGYLYGTTWVFGPGGNLEGLFKATLDTGTIMWLTDCHGDQYSSYLLNGIVYSVGHSHYCGNLGGGYPQYPAWKFQHSQAWSDTVTGDIEHDTHGYTDWGGKAQAPAMVDWLPEMAMGSYTGQYQAGWSVDGNADYVVIGGEFPRVNGTGQQGLVRFVNRSLAPRKEGPRFTAATFTPTVVPTSTISARVSWLSGYDRDDFTLTYKVIRNGAFGAPRYTAQVDSTWWNTPTAGFVDTGLSPGTTYSYQVVVSDPDGNTVYGGSTSITMPTTMAASNAYANAVRADGARIYWPLDDPRTGTPMTITDRAAVGQTAPNVGVTDGVADNDVTAGQPGAIPGDSAVSLGAAQPNQDWARIYAQGIETAPNTFTEQIWIKTTTNSGGRILGFGDLQVGNSGHRDRHVYMDNAGHLIFGVKAIDGSLRTVSSEGTYNDGVWHMITATMGSGGMALYVDGVRVGRRTDTTQGEVYLGGWRIQGDDLSGWPARPSMNNIIGSVDEMAIYPTALTQDAIIAQYTASGRTAAIPPAPKKPTAAFGSTVTDLTVNADASASHDPDGTITAYSWNWGDGTTSTGKTASHTYANAGAFTVTLTVIDNDGATDTITHQVTVAAQAVIAQDGFDRTQNTGWGNADTGGTWSARNGGAGFAVTDGVGTIKMNAGSGPSAYLNAVPARDVTESMQLGYDKAGSGSGIYTSLIARRNQSSDYRVKVRITATSTTLYLCKTVSGAETILKSQTISGLVYQPGDMLNVTFQVQGNGTTTLGAKLWLDGTTEPTGWSVTASDTTAALQSAGAVGIYNYLSGAATNAPITARIDNFLVTPA